VEVARKKDPVHTVAPVNLKTYIRINANEVVQRTAQKFGNINTTINYTFSILSYLKVGRDSSIGIATRYGLDGPGTESRWGGEICRTRPDRPWDPPSLLHNGYRVFTGVKRPGRDVDQPPPSTEVKERVEIYLYSPLWAFVACFRVNFTSYLNREKYRLVSTPHRVHMPSFKMPKQVAHYHETWHDTIPLQVTSTPFFTL